MHRDIKPLNILLENDVDRALLTDFGLARAVDDATVTHTGIVAGTPHYMSPEQANGKTVDERSDLFSLGASLYFMATGHPPFRAERAMAVLHRICNDRQRPVWEVNPDIPDELSEIIDRLLEKKPHKRFSSAGETRDALLGLLEKTQQPGVHRRRPKFRRWLRQRRRVIVGSLAVVGLTAGLAGLGSFLDFGASEATSRQAKNPAKSSNTARGDVRAALAELIELERHSPDRLDAELTAIQGDLKRAEAVYGDGARFLSLQRSDPWHSELTEVQGQLLRAEGSMFKDSQTEGKAK